MTETQTLTLTEFLLARIAEDEAIAQEVLRAVDAVSSEPREPWRLERGRLYLSRGVSIELKPELSAFVARHDPARVLAECEAKRRIVEDEHFDGRSGEHVAPFCSTCSDDENLVDLPCPTLRLLALPYADHPDYRDEWRP